MTHTYVFNGDADGLCALQQLRLADHGAGRAIAARLVTGVKRDIALLARVPPAPGDSCTVLDVSLDVNRAALLALLEAGVSVQYFDHHFAGDIPAHPGLAAHIDLAPNVCTSILVDRYLEGCCRVWAAVGAFGDSLNDEGRALAAAAGVSGPGAEQLRAIGVAVNYNAYGESVADLHVPPVDLAEEMLRFPDPLEMAERSALFRRVADGFRADMALAGRVQPARRAAGAVLFVLPDAAWSRRVSGTLANDLAKAHAGDAVALLSPRSSEAGGGYVVSIRVPRDARISAEAFCRRFPTGGGGARPPGSTTCRPTRWTTSAPRSSRSSGRRCRRERHPWPDGARLSRAAADLQGVGRAAVPRAAVRRRADDSSGSRWRWTTWLRGGCVGPRPRGPSCWSAIRAPGRRSCSGSCRTRGSARGWSCS